MNRNEYRFYKRLDLAIGLDYKIFAQVHFDELANPMGFSTSRTFSFRHINQKSVDFVLCTKNGLSPVLAIELDGKSHLKKETKDIDMEKERILKEIGLPLLRLGNENNLTAEEIKKEVREKIISQ